MKVECMTVGSLGANCYIVSCEETKEAAIIDPGGDADKILEYIKGKSLVVKYIINTHGHVDHIAGNDQIRNSTCAKVLIHELDANMLENSRLNLSELIGFAAKYRPADQMLRDGDSVEFGSIKLEVLHTPGHTLGGISLVADGNVFTGDTLFNASIGRTDFPGGDFDTIINSIKTRIMSLPDDTKVYPGHMGSSTVAQERFNNPFLK